MEQVFFNVPLSKLEPVFKRWIKEAQEEQRAENVPTPQAQEERLLTVEEAAKFLGLSVATIYSKVSRGELPVMKRSKRLYFSNVELLDYLKQGRKLTNEELAAEAENYVQQKRKG